LIEEMTELRCNTLTKISGKELTDTFWPHPWQPRPLVLPDGYIRVHQRVSASGKAGLTPFCLPFIHGPNSRGFGSNERSTQARSGRHGIDTGPFRHAPWPRNRLDGPSFRRPSG